MYEDFGDLVSAWANASSAWQEVFLPYGDNATAVDAAADASAGSLRASGNYTGQSAWRSEDIALARRPQSQLFFH
eukprot:1423396-Amphidinium_carterae.1